MRNRHWPTCFVILLLGITNPHDLIGDEREKHFEAKIRPVLSGTCFRCHGGAKTSGGLRVDSRESLIAGGDSGAAVQPGNPHESLLIKAISHVNGVSAMPPEKEKKLRPDQIADFETWIKSGAYWPDKPLAFESTRHWAFEPIRMPEVPKHQDDKTVSNEIDAFIRSRQKSAGISPTNVADKLTLIRRATYDLTGLPPTSEAIDAFVADQSTNAFEKVIDQLLQSTAYGERWGRHWLDVVRYADTAGETADYPAPLAWRYRNYVIDSFNSDKPYDQFLQEQIAGDILANLEPDSPRYAELVTATGYLAISRRFGFDSENYHHLTIQDTIDTLGQSVLGLTLGCVRCHDHKFDPISMADYYGLYGIFDSSRYPFPGSEQKQKTRTLAPLVPVNVSQPKWREYQSRIAELSSILAVQQQPVPSAILRSLQDLDGDFELQAPAAGGSNGVLVPPWHYEGPVSITNTAQSPFRNHYQTGRVGVSVAQQAKRYRIQQSFHSGLLFENQSHVYVNLDFRIGQGDSTFGSHRMTLGSSARAAVELILSPEGISLRDGKQTTPLARTKPNEWHNLQLDIDIKQRTVSGNISQSGHVSSFESNPLSMEWIAEHTAERPTNQLLSNISFESFGDGAVTFPSIELDNLGIQEVPYAALSVTSPIANPQLQAATEIKQQLAELVGIDGDFELQTKETPPSNPWGPGPNSVVKISESSQSPFSNLFPHGTLGIHMPNRAQYDGFGQTLVDVKPDSAGQLFVTFDFRCASNAAGGTGSWRYYLGHGPGHSAAIELFFNANTFFQRTGDQREAVCSVEVGKWYQVQLTLDLKARTYVGRLVAFQEKDSSTKDFRGALANGWDGTIDYTFIDSYGHLAGVRPSLDADNFSCSAESLPRQKNNSQSESAQRTADTEKDTRQKKIESLRNQLAELSRTTELAKQELISLLETGPFLMTYGMSEGTPHPVRKHLRGDPEQPGDEVPRGFIKILGGETLPPDTMGSGRLQLARWLTSPRNPLTARVMANRIWQFHFGKGLVETPNDFGVRGSPPTHPELLDYLSTKFIDGGWSVKRLHRMIMLSSSYQQSSRQNSPTVEDNSVEADNLYTSFRRRRLSAEEIRDSILFVSGELDGSPSREHPFPSPIGWGFSQHGPFNAVYDHNHRSVYLMTQRLKRHPFLALFDGPDPNASTAVRLTTTVPTQALFFLNDPFVHAKTDRWAQRLKKASSDERQQISLAYRVAFGRNASADELNECQVFLNDYAKEAALTSGETTAKHVALAALLRTLIGSNEFLHVE